MTKRWQHKMPNPTTWAALALVALMAAGALADATAQTRVRGGIKVDCPKEKSKGKALKVGEKVATFRITGCYCGGRENDLAGTKKSAADLMAEVANRINTGRGGSRRFNQMIDNINAGIPAGGLTREEGSQFLKKQQDVIDAWMRSHGLYRPTIVKVAPPPGGSKSKTHFCYDDIFERALNLLPKWQRAVK